jgi:ATP-binding cassette subfamily C protein
MGPLIPFLRRLLREQPLRFALVAGTLGFAGLMEGAGIVALIPVLQMINHGSGTIAPTGKVAILIRTILGLFGLPLTLATGLTFVFVMLLGQQFVILTQQKLAAGSQFGFEARLRTGLYRAIFSASWPFFVKRKAGDITNALTAEATRAAYAYGNLAALIGSTIVVVVYVGIALYMSWQMTAIVLASGAFVIWLLRSRVRRAADFGRAISATNAAIQSEAMENISGAKLIKGTGVEELAIDRFHRSVHYLAGQQYRNNLNGIFTKVSYDTVSLVPILVGIYLAATQFHMPIEQLIVFLFVFYRLSPKLSQLQTTVLSMRSQLPALDVIDRLSADAAESYEKPGGRALERLEQGILLDGVTFAYHPDKPVIRDLTIDIPKGKTVAIVGPSGSGKTTTIDLIMGLLAPGQGAVRVDGVPMTDLDMHSWRSKIGYVAQDAVFFNASVRENIGWICPDADQERIAKAAELAFASEFIDALPAGYDTIIGDRGVALSGGQRQRLALARTLIREPEILILDEATSSLDADSEQKIQRTVDHLAESMTIIMVSHRFSTVRNADLIYVLEDGLLIEHGTWDELLERRGRFRELKELQDLDARRAGG